METNGKHAFTETTNTYGEKYITEISHQIFSKLDSTSQYTSTFGKSFLLPNSFYIFCGTDSGLLLRHVTKSDIDPSSKYIFIELPEIIDWINNSDVTEDLPENISIIPFSLFSRKLNDFGINHYALQDNLFFLPSLAVQYKTYPPYSPLAEDVLNFIKTLHWNIRIDLDRKDFIVGQLENLAENILPCRILYNTFKGLTALLLAGGPSLDWILPWVKTNRDKIVLFAVSRIAKQLHSANVAPDFFVTVHTQPISFDVSKEMLLFSDTSILISHAQACPRLISQWRGAHVFMGHLMPWKSTMNGPSKDLVGPTVSHAAYDIIIKMGFSQIILGGIDLCYSDTRKSHATGSLEAELTTQTEGGDVQVVTNDGRSAETSFAFQRGIVEFGRMALEASNIGCRTINPSLSSARIDGVEVGSLDQISLNPTSMVIRDTIAALSVPEKKFLSHYQKISQELSQELATIRQIREKSLALFKKITSEIDTDYSNSIDGAKTFLESLNATTTKWIYETIYSFGIRFFNALVYPHDDSDPKGLHNYYRLYLIAIIVSADRLISHFQRSIKRTQYRIEEFNPEADIDALSDSWTADEQPGRAFIYQDRIAQKSLQFSDKIEGILGSLKSQYHELFTEKTDTTQHDELKHLHWSNRRLERLRQKIFESFSKNDGNTLDAISRSLASEQSDKVQCHRHLARGLSHELAKDMDKALGEYNLIIETNDPNQRVILQDGLSRIASISITLNDLDNAELALQCLADMSLDHMPTYADFLHLAGKTNDSLDVYADYLEKRPEDMQSMLKLGQLYKEVDSVEGVRMIAEHVLERDPSNQTALSFLKYIALQSDSSG